MVPIFSQLLATVDDENHGRRPVPLEGEAFEEELLVRWETVKI